jgi:hypothetical protein
MNKYTQRGAIIIIPTVLLILIIAALTTFPNGAGQTAVADTPPQPLPAFEGEVYNTQLEQLKGLNINPIPVPTDAHGWTIIYSDTFTTTLDANVWSSIDNDADTNGEYNWATGVYTSTGITDTIMARAISGGTMGSTLTETQGYPDNVNSWLVLGPFSTENASKATITFDFWNEAALGDYFGVVASTDGQAYSGLRQSGGVGEWNSVSYNLNDYVGQSSVYVAFIFTTNADGNTLNRLGAYLDNVSLYLNYPSNVYLPLMRQDITPTPANTPTPTPSPTSQSGNYLDLFDDPNSGWEMRRTNIGDIDDYAIIYRTDDILEMQVDKTDDYLLASPLVPAPDKPYNIEVIAQFTDGSKDRHLYGIIFSGNYNGSSQCPNTGFTSCFTSFYYLRVEWDETTANSPKLEYMLRRVWGFDEGNNMLATDLLGWSTLTGASPDGWHEWDILVENNGKITLSFDDAPLATVQDPEPLPGNYFGFIVETRAQGGARVKFDQFKANAE